MRNLSAFRESDFDVVAVANNALAHLLNKSELTRALQQIASKLRPGELFLATIRDYDRIWEQHPVTPPPAFFQDGPIDVSIIKSGIGAVIESTPAHLYITRQIETINLVLREAAGCIASSYEGVSRELAKWSTDA